MLPELEYELEEENTRPRIRVRHMTCTDAQRANIENLLQMSIPPAALRDGLDRAAGIAARWAFNAARALRSYPRRSDTGSLFRETFGVTPGFVPTWRPADASWRDRGELVALRLQRAGEILNGGSITYFCWGSPLHCPECTGSPTSYRACSSYQGRYIICLGTEFWLWWRDGQYNFMAATLLHEALHIYFNRTVSHERRFGNANCYSYFAARFNHAPVSRCTRERCLGLPC